jgi:hypothetical protein
MLVQRIILQSKEFTKANLKKDHPFLLVSMQTDQFMLELRLQMYLQGLIS